MTDPTVPPVQGFQGKLEPMTARFANQIANIFDELGNPAAWLQEISVTTLYNPQTTPNCMVTGFVGPTTQGQTLSEMTELSTGYVLHNVQSEKNHWDSHLLLYGVKEKTWYYICGVPMGGAYWCMI